jgi:uncharacterized protein (DUF1684 family)
MRSSIRRFRPRFTVALLICSLTVGATARVGGSEGGAKPPPAGTDAYRQEIEDWHQKRLQSLRNPEGYLSLVGLFPLVAGDNRFGSTADNDLVFPATAPAHAGVFVLETGAVRLQVAEGVEITADGATVTSAVLRSDADGGPTVLTMGSLRFYVIERAGDLFVRLKDIESEALRKFEGIDRFPVDAAWRIEARFEPYDPPKRVMVPNQLGKEFEEDCPGRAVFEVGSESYSLEPTSASNGQLFFVFGDGTSGRETYGGGRFLYTDPPSKDGIVFLDFNKAYNPPCVFSPFATCPLPREDNRLTLRIEAGEKTWGKGH